MTHVDMFGTQPAGRRAPGKRKTTNEDGPVRPRSRNPKRRAQVLAAALRVFYDKGYEATTLQDIADEMRFTKPAIYYYAKSKEELLLEIYVDIVEPAIERASAIAATDADGATRFMLLIEAHLRTFLENIGMNAMFDVHRKSLTPAGQRRVQQLGRTYGAILNDVYKAGVSDGSLVPRNPAVVVNATLGMCNTVHRWYDPRGELGLDDAIRELTDMLGSGILAART